MRAASKLSLLVLLLTVAIYSLPTFVQSENPILASIREGGLVKVAVASLPPYIVVSPSGEVAGSNIELQNMVLKVMGVPALTPVLTDWSAMIPALQAHQIDYLGSGLTITEERCKIVLFSVPYYAAQTGLFVQPENPSHLTSIAEIAGRPGVRLAVITGSSQEAYVLKRLVRTEQLLRVPDNQAGIATVTGGRADAFVAGQFTIPNPEQKGVEVIVDKESPVDGASMAFRKEDKAFRDAINEHMIPLIRDGTFEKLYEKYGIPNGKAMAQLLVKFTKASDVVPGCE